MDGGRGALTGRRHLRITERDRAQLGFVAEHRIVLGSHVQALLGTSASAAYARIRALSRAGMLRHEALFERQPQCYWITGRGLALIASDLPPPRLDPRSYKHDVGLAWLWLAARGGAFGPLRGLVSERRMRSQDAARVEPEKRVLPEAPFAVRLGGLGPRGRERLHYPDLLLIGRDGRRVAVELELTSKSRTRRERILAGYAADRRFDHALYLVENAAVGRGIETAADRLGMTTRVHLRRIRWGEQRAARAPAAAEERARAGRVSAAAGERAPSGRLSPRRGSDAEFRSAGVAR